MLLYNYTASMNLYGFMLAVSCYTIMFLVAFQFFYLF